MFVLEKKGSENGQSTGHFQSVFVAPPPHDPNYEKIP